MKKTDGKGYSLSFSGGNVVIKQSGRTVFSGRITMAGAEKEKKPLKVTVLKKSGNRFIFKLASSKRRKHTNLELEGIFHLPEAIPCFLSPERAPKNVLSMTGGQPETSYFKDLYFRKDDLAVKCQAAEVHTAPASRKTQTTLKDSSEIGLVFSPDYYRNNFNPFFRPMDKKLFPKPPVGWLSWYCYFGDFDEEKTLETLDFASKHLKDFGLEYIQLENWMPNSRKPVFCAWHHGLEWDREKFPHGLKYIADRIHEKGLKAGLWIVPLATGDEKIFNRNREMFLVDKQGKPIKSWGGYYNLDPTHPKAKEYIIHLLQTITRKWGYDYLKIDGLECGGGPPETWYADDLYRLQPVQKLFYRRDKNALRAIALLIRKAIGPKIFFTVCGGKIKKNGVFIGIGNAGRIGGDVIWVDENPQWKAVKHTAAVTTRAYHVHNIFWYNDPDVLCLRPPLTDDHARAVATVDSITGQLLFAGDILYEMPPERVEILRKLMPVNDTYPGLLFRTEEVRDIWNLIIKKDFEQWNVTALFNWQEEGEKGITLNSRDIGLDENKEYLAYEFWSEKFLGGFRKLRIFQLPPQSCMLLAIREKKTHPQILSVNRHITQDAVTMQKVTWSLKRKSLSGISEVPGEYDYVITVHVPDGYRVRNAEVDKGAINLRQEEPIVLKTVLRCLEKTTVNWKINFENG